LTDYRRTDILVYVMKTNRQPAPAANHSSKRAYLAAAGYFAVPVPAILQVREANSNAALVRKLGAR
jgi:hypothetical protein